MSVSENSTRRTILNSCAMSEVASVSEGDKLTITNYQLSTCEAAVRALVIGNWSFLCHPDFLRFCINLQRPSSHLFSAEPVNNSAPPRISKRAGLLWIEQ